MSRQEAVSQGRGEGPCLAAEVKQFGGGWEPPRPRHPLPVPEPGQLPPPRTPLRSRAPRTSRAAGLRAGAARPRTDPNLNMSVGCMLAGVR